MAKRRTKGVLSAMGKAPKSKPKRKKHESPLRRVGRWIGTGLIVVVIVWVVGLYNVLESVVNAIY